MTTKKTIPLHLTKAQLTPHPTAAPAKKVIPLTLGHVTSAAKSAGEALSNVAAQEQAASASPSVDVPGEILHFGDGSAKQSSPVEDVEDAATRANAGLSGMSVGEKVGIVAAAGLAVAGVYKWLTKR